jgi:hypothetical protein
VTGRGSGRSWAAGVLAVLTVVSMVNTTVALWARETVYDTDRFMETVGPALRDPALSAALSGFISSEAIAALGLEERVAERLTAFDDYVSQGLLEAIDPDPRILAPLSRLERPTLSALAPPIASALETRVTALVEDFVTSERFQQRLPGLVEQAHRGGVAMIRDDLAELPNVYLEDGQVRLNLIPVITEALQLVVADISDFLPDVALPVVAVNAVQQGREQLVSALQAELPDDFGQLTLMREDSLGAVQTAARQVDRALWVIALLSLVLLAATIAASPSRRRAVVQLAVGLVAGAALAMLLVRRIEAAILAEIVNPDGTQAVRALFGELASSLRTVTILLAVVASVVGLAASLAGRSKGLWPTEGPPATSEPDGVR